MKEKIAGLLALIFILGLAMGIIATIINKNPNPAFIMALVSGTIVLELLREEQ